MWSGKDGALHGLYTVVFTGPAFVSSKPQEAWHPVSSKHGVWFAHISLDERLLLSLLFDVDPARVAALQSICSVLGSLLARREGLKGGKEREVGCKHRETEK